MSGAWDQTDVAMPFALALMVASNGQQSCVLALGSRVGLHRHGIVSGDLNQPISQLVNHFLLDAKLQKKTPDIEMSCLPAAQVLKDAIAAAGEDIAR